MVKKNSAKKSETWACSNGCDVQNSICEHLEKRLPDVNKGALLATKLMEMHDYAELTKQLGPEEPTEKWVAFLTQLGLNTFEAKVIVEIVINGASERNAAQFLGATSQFQVHTVKVKALEKLRAKPEFKEWLRELAREVKDE